MVIMVVLNVHAPYIFRTPVAAQVRVQAQGQVQVHLIHILIQIPATAPATHAEPPDQYLILIPTLVIAVATYAVHIDQFPTLIPIPVTVPVTNAVHPEQHLTLTPTLVITLVTNAELQEAYHIPTTMIIVMGLVFIAVIKEEMSIILKTTAKLNVLIAVIQEM